MNFNIKALKILILVPQNIVLKAFVLGFTSALIVYIASIFIWQIGFLAPILGGIIVAYIAAENYKDASLNGAIVGGLAASIALIIAFLVEFVIKNPGQNGIDIASFLILGAVDVFLGIILGVLGGLIGYYLEKRIIKDETK